MSSDRQPDMLTATPQAHIVTALRPNGRDRNRTCDHLVASEALCPLSYTPKSVSHRDSGWIRTSDLRLMRPLLSSAELHCQYRPSLQMIYMAAVGIEPTTPGLSSRCSPAKLHCRLSLSPQTLQTPSSGFEPLTFRSSGGRCYRTELRWNIAIRWHQYQKHPTTRLSGWTESNCRRVFPKHELSHFTTPRQNRIGPGGFPAGADCASTYVLLGGLFPTGVCLTGRNRP